MAVGEPGRFSSSGVTIIVEVDRHAYLFPSQWEQSITLTDETGCQVF
jgi:hypothetical protein